MCVSFYNQHQQILFLLYIYIQERLTHHRHIQFEPFVTNLSKQFMFLFILVRDICIKSSSFYIIISLCCVGLTTNLMKKICKFRSFFVFFFSKMSKYSTMNINVRKYNEILKEKKTCFKQAKIARIWCGERDLTQRCHEWTSKVWKQWHAMWQMRRMTNWMFHSIYHRNQWLGHSLLILHIRWT